MSLPPQHRDLGEPQQKAFNTLKQQCEQDHLHWPQSTLSPEQKHTIPDDNILHRYIRARAYNPQQAHRQLSETVKWRNTLNLDAAYDTVPVPQFETLRRLQPQWTGRCDRNGIPIFVYVVSQIDPSDLQQLSKDDPQLKSIFLAGEYVMNFVNPLASHVRKQNDTGGGGDVCTTANVIDLSNVGITRFWSLRRLLQTASNMATAHYPETVERIFVIGAPSYFGTVWRLINQWFDPQTTRKIRVLSRSETPRVLSEFIEPQNLPRRFGGELEWEFGMHPNLDPQFRGLLGELQNRWVEGPIRCTGDDIIAVGSENGQERRKVLGTFPASTPQTMVNGEMEMETETEKQEDAMRDSGVAMSAVAA